MIFFTSSSKVFLGPSYHRNMKKLLCPILFYGSINKRIITFLSLLSLFHCSSDLFFVLDIYLGFVYH
jgi:hypothetical protein